MFIIQPAHPWWRVENWKGAKPTPDGFRYASNSNPKWLSGAELREVIRQLGNGE